MSDESNTEKTEILRQAMNEMLAALGKVSDEADKRRLLNSVATLLGFETTPNSSRQEATTRDVQSPSGRPVAFSTDLSISPKEFLREKAPVTDVERIACLAYYLTHYRNTPHFKTLDLSQLNTEAAQPKFSNAAVAAQNALALGYLAPAVKGQRQISAAGEQFVRLLPDREAARLEMAKFRRRKPNRRKSDVESSGNQ